MLVACWSSKGGSGTTVVACALAIALGGPTPRSLRSNGDDHPDVRLVDLDGDVPTALGVLAPQGPGVWDWLTSADAPPDALDRLYAEVRGAIRVLHAGRDRNGAPSPGRVDAFVAALAKDAGRTVVDCGVPREGSVAAAVARRADASLLVLRPCYLALRRALDAPLRPTGIILVDEPGHDLGRADVEQIVGAPVRAVVPVEPVISRAVDAGLLAGRLPRSLQRAVRRAA
jgi:hypothetical protein